MTVLKNVTIRSLLVTDPLLQLTHCPLLASLSSSSLITGVLEMLTINSLLDTGTPHPKKCKD